MTSKISNRKLMIVRSITITASLTISANNAVSAIANVDNVDGYKPIAIVGIQKTGGGSGLLAVGGYYIAGDGNASIQIYNPSTSSRTIGVLADILYQPI